MKYALVPAALALALHTGHALGQPTGPGANQVPDKPDQRTWYPKTDRYFPEQLVGSWVLFRDGKTLEFIATNKLPTGATPKAQLLGPIRAYTLTISKGDEAKAGIPGFASVTLQDKEVQSLTIDDIASVDVGEGASELFCRDWGFLKNARDWKPGDEIRYITSALLSHVSWKIGKEHTAGAQLGLGDYFSANGSQYDQTSTSGTLPAIAIFTTFKDITVADIAGTSCTAPVKPHLVSDTTTRPTMLREVIQLPDK